MQKFGISGSFTAMNIYNLYSDLERAKQQQDWLVTNHGFKTANNCIKCGLCNKNCPQNLPIPDLLAQVQKEYEKAKASS